MLRLENIHAGYGSVHVLRGVDLRVPAGSAVALLGANGAGKTTLLRTAAGVIHPTSGHVRYDGTPIEHEPYYRRAQRGLCLIPEGRGIFRDLTVRDNLAMFSGDMRTSDAVDIAVDAFPALKPRLGQPAGQLSGGQQQMLAVTRALLPDTKVILADELSVGLAPVIIDEIFEVVAALKASGRSLLIVEQYVDRVLEVADYVYILHKGRIVFVGEPEHCLKTEIFDQYIGAAAHS